MDTAITTTKNPAPKPRKTPTDHRTSAKKKTATATKPSASHTPVLSPRDKWWNRFLTCGSILEAAGGIIALAGLMWLIVGLRSSHSTDVELNMRSTMMAGGIMSLILGALTWLSQWRARRRCFNNPLAFRSGFVTVLAGVVAAFACLCPLATIISMRMYQGATVPTWVSITHGVLVWTVTALLLVQAALWFVALGSRTVNEPSASTRRRNR